MKNISIIVCCDKNGGFAKERKIPWLADPVSKIDLKHFKDVTAGSDIIMGRNTYNEIAGLREIKQDILPGRKSYVLTSNIFNACPGANTTPNISLALSNTTKDVFFIGGASVFEEGLKYCNQVYLSYINKDYDCDQFFPGDILKNWSKEITLSDHQDLIFVKYTKIEDYAEFTAI